MNLDFDKPSRRRDGQLGARANVRCGGRWPETYVFDTHGMNSSQVAAKADELAEYHEAKMAKLESFADVRGTELVAGADTYRIADCTVFDAGVTLYLDVRKVGHRGSVKGFPIRMKYRYLSAIPSNEEIIEIVRASLPDDADVKEAHDVFVKKVRGKVKG